MNRWLLAFEKISLAGADYPRLLACTRRCLDVDLGTIRVARSIHAQTRTCLAQWRYRVAAGNRSECPRLVRATLVIVPELGKTVV